MNSMRTYASAAEKAVVLIVRCVIVIWVIGAFVFWLLWIWTDERSADIAVRARRIRFAGRELGADGRGSPSE